MSLPQKRSQPCSDDDNDVDEWPGGWRAKKISKQVVIASFLNRNAALIASGPNKDDAFMGPIFGSPEERRPPDAHADDMARTGWQRELRFAKAVDATLQICFHILQYLTASYPDLCQRTKT